MEMCGAASGYLDALVCSDEESVRSAILLACAPEPEGGR